MRYAYCRAFDGLLKVPTVTLRAKSRSLLVLLPVSQGIYLKYSYSDKQQVEINTKHVHHFNMLTADCARDKESYTRVVANEILKRHAHKIAHSVAVIDDKGYDTQNPFYRIILGCIPCVLLKAVPDVNPHVIAIRDINPAVAPEDALMTPLIIPCQKRYRDVMNFTANADLSEVRSLCSIAREVIDSVAENIDTEMLFNYWNDARAALQGINSTDRQEFCRNAAYLECNTGASAGQVVFHMHAHLKFAAQESFRFSEYEKLDIEFADVFSHSISAMRVRLCIVNDAHNNLYELCSGGEKEMHKLLTQVSLVTGRFNIYDFTLRIRSYDSRIACCIDCDNKDVM